MGLPDFRLPCCRGADGLASHLSPFPGLPHPTVWSCVLILCWTLRQSWMESRGLLVPTVTLRAAEWWPMLDVHCRCSLSYLTVAPRGCLCSFWVLPAPHGLLPFTLLIAKVWMVCLSLSCWSASNSPPVSRSWRYLPRYRVG